MTLGEFREQTKGMSDDLELEFYSERYNDSTQPIRLDFDTEGYIEFIIDNDRWDLVDKRSTFIIPIGATNGDMIKAMFPDLDIEVEGGYVTCWIDEYRWIGSTGEDLSWWNTPYKRKEQQENKDKDEKPYRKGV